MYQLYSPASSGKNEWARRLCWSDLPTRLFGIAFAGGSGFSEANIGQNYAVNNPFLCSSKVPLKFAKIISEGALLTDPLEIVNKKHVTPVSDAEFITLLGSGMYFTNKNDTITNAVLCIPDQQTLLSKEGVRKICLRYLDEEKFYDFLFVLELYDREKISRFSNVFCNNNFLNSDRKLAGLPFIVWEGINQPCTHYLSPEVLIDDSGTLAKRFKNNYSAELTKILSEAVLEASGNQTPDSFHVIPEILSALGDGDLKIGGLNKERQERAQMLKNALVSLNKESSYMIHPFKVLRDKRHYSWLNIDGSLGSIDEDPLTLLIRSKCTFIIDSMLSLLWTEGKAAGTGGINTDVLRLLSSSTYNGSVLLRAPLGNNDPLDDYSMYPLMTGQLVVDSDVSGSFLGLNCWITHRATGRAIRHMVSFPVKQDDGTTILVVRNAFNEQWNEKSQTIILERLNALSEIIDVAVVNAVVSDNSESDVALDLGNTKIEIPRSLFEVTKFNLEV